jgi:hypothetical protein
MSQHHIKQFILAELKASGDQLVIPEEGQAKLRAEFIRLAQMPDAYEAGMEVVDLIALMKVAAETKVAEVLVRLLGEVINTAYDPDRRTKFAAFTGADARAKAPAAEDRIPDGAGRPHALPGGVAIPIRG